MIHFIFRFAIVNLLVIVDFLDGLLLLSWNCVLLLIIADATKVEYSSFDNFLPVYVLNWLA